MYASLVKSCEISVGSYRLEAGFHLSDGARTLRHIRTGKHRLLTVDQLSKDIFIGGRSRRTYVNDERRGIPFLSSSDMMMGDFQNAKYVSKKYTKDLGAMMLGEGWTLISRSGTIGKDRK